MSRQPKESGAALGQIIILHAQGVSSFRIALALTEQGIPPLYNVDRWNATTVRNILKRYNLWEPNDPRGATSHDRWKCRRCGLTSTPAGIASHQRSSGHTGRRRIA